MKHRRWRRYTIAAIVLLSFAMVTWFSIRPRPHLNVQMIDRLQFGMTLAEVESLVKAPPGDYAIGSGRVNQVRVKTLTGYSGIGCSPAQGIERIVSESRLVDVKPEYRNWPSATWMTYNRSLFVVLDDYQRVVFVAIGYRDEPEQDWLDRCFGWIDSWIEETQ